MSSGRGIRMTGNAWFPRRVLIGVVILVSIGIRLNIVHAIRVTLTFKCWTSSYNEATSNNLSAASKGATLVMFCAKMYKFSSR